MTYLRNCWYMAAWADEIAPDAMLARRILDDPIVLFRDAQGDIRALSDRCPHRFAPLSRGTLSGGAIACGYHGLTFGGDGRCIHNPHGPAIPQLAVRGYPILEAHRAVWVWMGEPDAASAETLRDLSFLDAAPDAAFSKGYLLGDGGYELFVDNILDLTHADFLHPTTLGGGAFTRTRARVTEAGDHVAVRWDCVDEIPSPMMRESRRLDEGARVDSWTHVEWSAPAVMTLETGAVPAGTSREQAGRMMNVHIMTPETSRTTHYFFASARDFALEDAELNQRIAETRTRIFATEDKPMIQAQQDRMGAGDFWSLKPVLLPIDAGGVRVRRKLQRMIQAESGTHAAEEVVSAHE